MKHLLVAIAFLAGACADDEPRGTAGSAESPPVAATAPAASDSSSFDFDRPSLSFVLPEELTEISGLGLLPDGRLATVQDEEGTLYILNRETGTVEARVPFGESGDYEGVEWIGDKGFVLLSDGTIIELSGSLDNLAVTATHETPLKRKNDAEGLGFDAQTGRLLIACKEDPGSGLDEDDERAVYAFDPATGEMDEEPVYTINLKEVEDLVSDLNDFKPSAIAVHPSSGELYLLSASDRAIAILGSDGRLKTVRELSRDVFEQPEGLAFLSDGTLYISSEGQDGPGMLYEFRSPAAR